MIVSYIFGCFAIRFTCIAFTCFRIFNNYLYHNVFVFIGDNFSTHPRIYFACSLAASCFSCFVGVIPSYLYNSLAASLIIVFIVLQFASVPFVVVLHCLLF